MIALPLSEIARLIGGRRHGADVPVRGCSTDSRTVAPGAVFFALTGPSFDGHAYVADAGARGAVAAVLARPPPPTAASLPWVEVADPRASLGVLARAWRRRFSLPVVAVTGSNGKTTVKEMVAAILRAHGHATEGGVLATRGNLNNDIGVPLTVFELGPEHWAAVVELGANHPGEIAALTAMVEPRVGIVTQCAPAHLEGFGSIEGVARAKGELFAGLAAGAIAVINADDPFAGLWRSLAGERRQLTFGLSGGADVGAELEPAGDPESERGPAGRRLRLILPGGQVDVQLRLPGRHNVANALAAAAAAWALEVPAAAIAAGLESVRTVDRRLAVHELPSGARVIDDSYNANPGSLAAALAVLQAQGGRRWLVLGDMAELGGGAGALHADAAAAAHAAGVERLYTLGPNSARASAAFGACARHCASHEDLAARLGGELETGVTVLVKGSRSMRMERVVDALLGMGGGELDAAGTARRS